LHVNKLSTKNLIIKLPKRDWCQFDQAFPFRTPWYDMDFQEIFVDSRRCDSLLQHNHPCAGNRERSVHCSEANIGSISVPMTTFLVSVLITFSHLPFSISINLSINHLSCFEMHDHMLMLSDIVKVLSPFNQVTDLRYSVCFWNRKKILSAADLPSISDAIWGCQQVQSRGDPDLNPCVSARSHWDGQYSNVCWCAEMIPMKLNACFR
jgi:hypothetical protein